MVLRELGVEFRNGVLRVQNLHELQKVAGFNASYLYLSQKAKEPAGYARHGSARTSERRAKRLMTG